MICISLGIPDYRICKEILCDERFADCIFELRTDLLGFSLEELDRLFHINNRIIISIKEIENNGEFAGECLKKFSNKAPLIDLPNNSPDSLVELCRKASARLILSYHNHETTPEKNELRELARDMRNRGADIAKIACRAVGSEDCATMLSLYSFWNLENQTKASKCRLNAFALGRVGRFTRFASVLLGAPFAYCSPFHGGETADGQFSADIFERIYGLIHG